ncbi:MAG: TRAP transporter large permease subunit [Candidatus Latescibacterota bacterium]|nr:TRAP transporter large permease subunit [Candidatus Latescibacterota bacterium]
MISAAAVLFALLGTPLFVVISALALISFFRGGIDLTVVFIEMSRLAETPTLTAIPLFAFTGFLLAESGAAQRFVRVSETLLSWLPGGLAIMALCACALLTAFTGASGMTIVAVGGLLYKALKQKGYAENFTLGLLTTSGSLGLLFPPSLALILYGVVSGTPIDLLFVAGLPPGLLLVVALSVYCYVIGRRQTAARTIPWSATEALTALRDSCWELLLPVVVVGGIYSGVIAVSEAAALSALYVFVVEVFVHREISLRQLPDIMRQTMVLVGSIIIILGAAFAYTNYMIDAEIPNRLLDYMRDHVSSRFLFLLLLNLFLLAVGCLIDMFSALVVVVPLVLPIASSYGVDPVHLGIIFLVNLEIGYSTPPVGLNLFIASARFERPVLQLYWASLPFLLILLAALVVITYVPQLSLFAVSD